MAVPQVRAAVLEVLHIGAVRIFLEEPAPSMPKATATATPQLQMPAAVLCNDAVDVLVWARRRHWWTLPDRPASRYGCLPIRPTPARPDQVYMANTSGPVAGSHWQEPDAPNDCVLLCSKLHGCVFRQGRAADLETTDVNGNRAPWITGAHEIYDLTQKRR